MSQKKYEYRVVDLLVGKPDQFQTELNDWGQKGWELVGTVECFTGYEESAEHCVFKREIIQPPEPKRDEGNAASNNKSQNINQNSEWSWRGEEI